MATPPTHAILIQHLHVIYDVLLLTLVIGVFLRPRGVRTQHTDIWRGTQWTTQLLHGHEERLRNVTRMKPEVFRKLLDWMQEYGDLKDSKRLSAAEKLLIFLFLFSSNASYRMACELTQHASSTIYEVVYEVLPGLLKLHKEIVKPPPNQTPEEILVDPKRHPYFADCIGALDGMHLPVFVEGGYVRQAPWRSRKGGLSQNVLVAVDFKLNFVYVFAGWEGSAHDSRVLASAKSKGFQAPSGRYYVADAGYPNTTMTLTPYRGVRYHLHEQVQGNVRPQNYKELYNLRHAALRNVIERAMGIFKSRFKCFEAAKRNLPLRTQVELVYALTAVHNFINQWNPDDLNQYPAVEDEEVDEEVDEEDARLAEEESDVVMNERREDIARLMWASYCQAFGRPIN